MRARHYLTPLVATAVGLAPLAAGGTLDDALARGDDAWQRRAEGRSELRAAPGPIAEAVTAYSEAFEAAPDDLATRWKLMRALYYQGEYALENRSAKLATFARGLDLGEGAIDLLAAALGGRAALDSLAVEERAAKLEGNPHAAPIYFWTCMHWGLWGRETGKLAAVRRGVAGKVREYAEMVIALDETYEDGGAHRILGRLHFEAPKVPFITGWIDRETARRSLRRAAELAPDSVLSRLFLIEALHRYEPERRAEAVTLLSTLVAEPRPELSIEDARALVDARELLEEWTR